MRPAGSGGAAAEDPKRACTMMRALPIAMLACVIACRGGATTVRYAGPPVAQCLAGRAYQPPAVDAPTQPFVPLARADAADVPPDVEPAAFSDHTQVHGYGSLRWVQATQRPVRPRSPTTHTGACVRFLAGR